MKDYKIEQNMIRFYCDCYPFGGLPVKIMPLNDNRYLVVGEPASCHNHPGTHILQQNDVIIVKHGRYQCISQIDKISTTCTQCGNSISPFQHENLLGSIVCKNCYKEIIERI